MRKIHEIFQPLKPLGEGVVHWSQVHGNMLLKNPDNRMLKAFTRKMNVCLWGTGTKTIHSKHDYYVVFDRSFLVAKIYQVLFQLLKAGISLAEIKLLLDDAYTVLQIEQSGHENQGEHESSH
jgi:hypothetical protein